MSATLTDILKRKGKNPDESKNSKKSKKCPICTDNTMDTEIDNNDNILKRTRSRLDGMTVDKPIKVRTREVSSRIIQQTQEKITPSNIRNITWSTSLIPDDEEIYFGDVTFAGSLNICSIQSFIVYANIKINLLKTQLFLKSAEILELLNSLKAISQPETHGRQLFKLFCNKQDYEQNIAKVRNCEGGSINMYFDNLTELTELSPQIQAATQQFLRQTIGNDTNITINAEFNNESITKIETTISESEDDSKLNEVDLKTRIDQILVKRGLPNATEFLLIKVYLALIDLRTAFDIMSIECDPELQETENFEEQSIMTPVNLEYFKKLVQWQKKLSIQLQEEEAKAKAREGGRSKTKFARNIRASSKTKLGKCPRRILCLKGKKGI